MGYEPLHHKYRPQTFAQLVGQSAIATTLSSALNQQRIAPAYLFSGPRGTGKTSSARILAKCLNCKDGPKLDPPADDPACREIAQGTSFDVEFTATDADNAATVSLYYKDNCLNVFTVWNFLEFLQYAFMSEDHFLTDDWTRHGND